MLTKDTTISERVVRAVATETDTEPLALPQLYESIDPDALDAVIPSMSAGEVRFRYAGYTVTVESRGAVRLDGPITASSSGTAEGYEVPD